MKRKVNRPRNTNSSTVRGAVALILAGAATARAATLPVPCPPSACNGGKVSGWSSTPGAASYVQSGNSAKVTQNQNSVVLNWQSFNISSDGTVTFVQPSSSAVALNRVFDVNPSTINGALNANGQIYLINQNGVLFGQNAQVNVGALLASSLNISQAATTYGIAGAATQGFSDAFEPFPTGTSKDITVSQGAQITAGQVYLFAPNVTNSGTIQTPSGQTILGAGNRIFLAPSGVDDSFVRGLVIEVGDGGTVTNTAQGTIISTVGNVTLAGLAVNQQGRVSATTTALANGSIVLQARDTSATALSSTNSQNIAQLATRSGTLTLGTPPTTGTPSGPTSETSVTLEDDGTKAVDGTAQPKSQVSLFGGTILMEPNSSIVAPSGNVVLDAYLNPQLALQSQIPLATPLDNSRIYLAPTSTIDVSGANVTLPMDANSLEVQLRGAQLADFPQQINSPIYGENLYIDIRQYGTRSDGSPWVGSPIGDLSGYLASIQRNVFERNLTGGTVTMNTTGSVIASKDSTINVSGGSITYQSGYLQSSVLLGADGNAYPIASANPEMTYVGTVGAITQSDPYWGVSNTVTLPIAASSQGQYVQGYVEGKDAGTVAIAAPAAILDGTLNGGVTVGPYQRLPSTNWQATPGTWPVAGQLYRPYDQVPVAGTLILGANAQSGFRQLLQNVTFAPGTVLDTLTGTGGEPFDPTTDPLPANFVTTVRPDMLGSGGMGNLQVYAEGTIKVPAGITLSPGAGASVTLNAGEVDLAGNIDIPGGTVVLQAQPTLSFPGGEVQGGVVGGGNPSLLIEKGATIDVSGEWVNDELALAGGTLGPLFTGGGTVSLLSDGSLVFPAGAAVKASGGAQLTASGSLVFGSAGSITVSATAPSTTVSSEQFVDSGLVEAYALSNGGNLSVTLPTLCVSSQKCDNTQSIEIDPTIFTNFGFGKVSLASELGSLTVASDVNVAATEENYTLLPSAYFSPSARSLTNLTGVTLLPQNLRKAENISLQSAGLIGASGQTVYGDLTIAAGASIAVDPGATISLASNSRIFQNGTLVAPGGAVNMKLTSISGTYQDDQGIWLGPNSLIDVSGVVEKTPNSLGLELGSVLAGGTINIDASGAGYVYALPGSTLNASGTSGTLDLQAPGAATYTRTAVASAGGSITVDAAEGIQLDGVLSAHAGGSTASGGSLSVILDGSFSGDRESTNGGVQTGYPSVPRNIEIAADSAPVLVAEGSGSPQFLNGQGVIAASTINTGGFDNVSLTAVSFVTSTSTALGTVSFDSGVSLHPASSLVIDAAQIGTTGHGGAVTLASDYVEIGSTNTLNQDINSKPTGGPTSLNISGNLVDLVGALDINGFGATSINSSGDVRAVGVQLGTNGSYAGQLTVPGSLTLTAQQVYPTTMTTYAVNVVESGVKSTSVLNINPAAGQADTVLSAAGTLSLSADNVTVSGVVRAPIGTINVNATDVTLNPGAILSVSTNGATIPFGQTQGGLDWVYTLNSLQTNVYGTGTGDILPPQKQVNLTATVLNDKGGTIDLSGGGDLEAYEWVPGLGGNANVLAPQATRTVSTSRGYFAPNSFAIVPTADLPYAPIDPNLNTGFGAAVAGAGFKETSAMETVGASNATIHLSGGGGVPAGNYAILPAYYAVLIKGAYLVEPASGYANLAPGQAIHQLDGSTIVSGYRTYGGTGLGDTQTSGWDVIPVTYNTKQSAYGIFGQESAQYNVTTANSFFSSEAAAADVTTPRLPMDAGGLAINITASTSPNVTSSISLEGSLVTSTPSGGRGATVDFAGSNLFITNNPRDVPAQGGPWVVLNASQIDNLGAESVLIGGTRTAAANATDLNIDASTVVVDQGAQLTGQEFILAAQQQLTIDSGASIVATGSAVAAEAPLQVQTGTALVRVSTGTLTDLAQPATTGQTTTPALTGAITVASGATISAPGSVSFDAGGPVSFQGNLSAAGAGVRLGANQIAFGNVPSTFQGFQISDALLAGLANTNLTLDSYSTAANTASLIQANGSVNLSVASLNIAAGGIQLGTGATFNVTAAQSITLANPTTQAVLGTSGSGTLALSASEINLGPGTFAIWGTANPNTSAASTSLSATKDITATADGTLTVDGGLSLASAVMQSAAGVNYNFIAPGAVTTALAGTAVGTTSASGPGGSLSFTGQSVTLGGNIILPAGLITAVANGPGSNVAVADGATLNVAGFSLNFDGETQSASGGTISLTSTSGNIIVASSATLDVSAGTGQGGGGALSLTAPSGNIMTGTSGSLGLAAQLHGAGATGESGAGLTIDANQFGDLTSLVNYTQAAGFTGAWNLHERGNPNLVLDSGTKLTATGVSITTDGGGIDVEGTIDTSSTLGGTIVLAGNTVAIGSSAQLLANSTTRTDRGGTIDLFSAGAVSIANGAILNVGGAGGADTGTVLVRVPGEIVESLWSSTGASLSIAQGAVTGASNVYLEGYLQCSSQACSSTPNNVISGNATIDDNFVSFLQGQTAQFMQNVTANATAITNALGKGVTVLPGIEIDSTGDLTVSTSSPWDFYANGTAAWRYGANNNIPGVLTLRAGGNLYVDSTISDGVAIANPNSSQFPPVFVEGATTGQSWSYRFAAGADLNSANPLAVMSAVQLPASSGNFVVGPGLVAEGNTNYLTGGEYPTDSTQTAIRTGTGSINVAAAGNVTLTNQASVIYTVGTGSPSSVDATGFDGGTASNFENLPYPTGGGSISVTAGGNIVGAPSNQLFTDWLWRTGCDCSPTLSNGQANPNYAPVSWTSAVNFFNQGIGALGGGDVTVTAAGNITDLGANVPSVGRPNADGTAVELDNGVLRVTAGGDIAGGKFLDMAGQAFIQAGGGLVAGMPQTLGGGGLGTTVPGNVASRGLYPVLAVSSGQFDVTARRTVSVESVLDPTLLPESQFQMSLGGNGNNYFDSNAQPFFATYSDSTSVTVRSIGSDVLLPNQTLGANSILALTSPYLLIGNFTQTVSGQTGSAGGKGGDSAFRLLPPSFAAVSLGGDVTISGSMELWPAANGNLDLLAAGSVTFQPVGSSTGGGNSSLIMSDANPSQLPSVNTPLIGSGNSVIDTVIGDLTQTTGPNAEHASSPLHGGAYSSDQQPDSTPARIVALTGDVEYVQPSTISSSLTNQIYIPKPLDVLAGGDISNVSLEVQQFASSNVSNISAGGNITYTNVRASNGVLQTNSGGIEIDGPGQANITAGGNINLGTSSGIVSVGNLNNPALPQGGANITVEAGVPLNPTGYGNFITTYLANEDTYDQQLIQYMEGFGGAPGITKSQALSAFQALPTADQTGLIDTVLFDELTASGDAAAAAGATHGNYSQGFNALKTLFPGSDVNLSQAATNPYPGNIVLDFSRVYTEQGGDINMLAPGGEIDVGLAVAPASFGITKSAAQLGIVAQSTGAVNLLANQSVNVNQSRVFAADGGDILIWSTWGNIDAGRGSKTAISAPPPTITIDPSTGKVTVVFPPSLQGSGIQALATSTGVSPGNVTLVAPNGVVNANDAGIVAGNITIAATAVLGASNITFSGTAVGLPPPVIPLGAVTSSASNTATSATQGAENTAGENASQSKSPISTGTLGWLDVFVLGMGEEQCKTDDLECLKRQKHE